MKMTNIDIDIICGLNSDFIYHYSEDSVYQYNSIKVMHKFGIAFANIYWYKNDSEDQLYISDLHVSYNRRNEGFGRDIMKLYEDIGGLYKFKCLSLFVDPSSWVKDWYSRLGFTATEDKCDEYFIWMNKFLY